MTHSRLLNKIRKEKTEEKSLPFNDILRKDKKETCGAVLKDSFKDFRCLQHKLLLAKLNAYGFDESSLKYIKKVIESKELKLTTILVIRQIFCNVPQGSTLGHILFNIFLCDLFLHNTDIASYADDNTPYATSKSTNK